MATSSIFTNVKVKSKTDCEKLILALENAQCKKNKEVVLSRPVEVIKGEKVKDLFKIA